MVELEPPVAGEASGDQGHGVHRQQVAVRPFDRAVEPKEHGQQQTADGHRHIEKQDDGGTKERDLQKP